VAGVVCGWSGNSKESRQQLFDLLMQHTDALSMRRGRMIELFRQTIVHQIDRCTLHCGKQPTGLLNDHVRTPGFLQNEFCVLQGHTDEVWHVNCPPDGLHIASDSKDSTVIVSNWRELRAESVLPGHTGPFCLCSGVRILRAL